MKKEYYSVFNGIFWVCLAKDWQDQENNCKHAKKSLSRPHCQSVCELGRCDNVFAHKPLPQIEED
jgi:hypothetical protein